MKSSFRYAKVGTAVVGVVVLLTWPFLNSESWRGVLIAALVALPVQVISFALLQRYRHELKRFIIVLFIQAEKIIPRTVYNFQSSYL